MRDRKSRLEPRLNRYGLSSESSECVNHKAECLTHISETDATDFTNKVFTLLNDHEDIANK